MTKTLMFDAPRENETQGTVFSCAYAEDYTDTSVYGLVITARCDAAQDKAPIFSYIPVVSLPDWVLCDGRISRWTACTPSARPPCGII